MDKMPASRIILFPFYHPVDMSMDFMDGMSRIPCITPCKKGANREVIVFIIDSYQGAPGFSRINFASAVSILCLEGGVVKVIGVNPASVKFIKSSKFVVVPGWNRPAGLVDDVGEGYIFYASVGALVGEKRKLMRLPFLPVIAPFTAIIRINDENFAYTLFPVYFQDYL
jgi:hypothetical protein